MAVYLQRFRAVSEEGKVVGKVGNVLIDASTPVALRVVAFELGGDSGDSWQRRPTFNANEVSGCDRDMVIIFDKAARRL